MNILTLTVGLPRSGKSTWAKIQTEFPIVNPDSIRLALHGKPFIAEAEDMVWVLAKQMVKSLFIAGHGGVIVDATNTTVKRRAFWKNRMWKRDYEIFHTQASTCLERVMSDESLHESQKQGLLDAIERMDLQYEVVQSEERQDWENQNYTGHKFADRSHSSLSLGCSFCSGGHNLTREYPKK